MIAALLRDLTSRHRAWAAASLWLLVVTVINVQSGGAFRSTLLYAVPVALVAWQDWQLGFAFAAFGVLAAWFGGTLPEPGSTAPLWLDGTLAFTKLCIDAWVVNAWGRRRRRRHEPASRPDDVTTWLQPEQVHLDVPLQDSTQALQYIAGAVARVHRLDPAPIFRALSRREQAGSTGLGGGFAVPHARIPGIERPLTLLVRARKPIDFGAPDHEPVSLVLGILVPEQGDRDDHLQLLARVAELYSQPKFRARMDTDPDVETLKQSIEAGISRLQA